MKKINLQVSKVPHFGHFKLISLLIKYSRFVDTCKLRLHRNLLLSKGSLPDTQRSQYYGTGFWEKKMRYCEVTQQGSNPSPWCKVWGVKGFQHWISPDSGPFSSGRALASRLQACPGPLVPRRRVGWGGVRWGAAEVSQVFLLSGFSIQGLNFGSGFC